MSSAAEEARQSQAAPAAGDAQQNPAVMFKNLLVGNTLVPLLIGGAAVIAAVVALLMWASTPNYRVLFSNLGEADGGRIINELDARGVPYEFGTGGRDILVPADQVHTLRLQLAEQGLPQGSNVGFELMDDQDFGISQFSEQVNFQRSLEGELSRSIESMNPVALARVHLSMAKPSVFVRDHEAAKASVVLTLHGGRTLGRSQVKAITHLVSSSVPQLSPDDVTVVDHGGNLLSADSAGQGGDQMSYTQGVERHYQTRIANILKPLFGEDNVRVQVAADIDFSVREETVERYAPNQGDKPAAIRSTQLNGTLNGSDAMARGIPGALSNTPPSWAPSPLNENDELAPTEDEAGTRPATPADSLRYDKVINYEVDRNITHIQHQRGRIERLTVATVVNYRDGVNEDGEATQLPLSDEEMAQVRRLVSQAMGFSAARDDQLEVMNSPFATDFHKQVAQPEWWMKPGVQDMILSLSRYLIAALFALFLYRVIVRPLLKRHLGEAPTGGAGAALASASAPPAAAGASDQDGPRVAPRRPKRERKASNYEEDLKEVRELAKGDSRLVAMVVRSWVNKNG